jgi:hypothetical protein
MKEERINGKNYSLFRIHVIWYIHQEIYNETTGNHHIVCEHMRFTIHN